MDKSIIILVPLLLPGQLGQQSPGCVSGIAPSGQSGHPHTILSTILSHDEDLFFFSIKVERETKIILLFISCAITTNNHYFTTEFLPGQLGQQFPGWVSGMAPSGHSGQPHTISSHDEDLFFFSVKVEQENKDYFPFYKLYYHY